MNYDVPRETGERLAAYVQLLLKWNATINLIGKTTETEIWGRHIWDSWQLVPLVPRGTRKMVDLGSGAGLPGLILAIAFPESKITLVERDARKVTFLREAVRALALDNVTVLQKDAMELTETYDIVTARALAALSELFSLASRIMGKGAICLFPKGENFAKEIEEAAGNWVFEHQVIPSKTNEKAGIVSVSQLKLANQV